MDDEQLDAWFDLNPEAKVEARKVDGERRCFVTYLPPRPPPTETVAGEREETQGMEVDETSGMKSASALREELKKSMNSVHVRLEEDMLKIMHVINTAPEFEACVEDETDIRYMYSTY